MLVTLLIPCHNEREGIPSLFEELSRVGHLLGPCHFPEVVFVDDGSDDGTARVLRDLADTASMPVRILGLAPRRGIGAALREGAALAAGQVVVTYDADRPYPLSDTPRLLAAIEEGFDIATASPWHPEGSAGRVGLWRAILSRSASRLYRLRLGRRARGLATFTCGFRAYRKGVLMASLPRRDGFAATAEILLNALRSGARVKEIPSTLRPREHGESKMRTWSTVLAHLRLLLGG